MSFIDFLLKNYIYILVVLIILIVIVIGFLADKRDKKKKGKDLATSQQQPNANQINPQMQNQTMPVQQPQIVPQSQINNQPVNNSQTIAFSGMPINTQDINTQPVASNNMAQPQIQNQPVQQSASEPLYKPLSEQQPSFNTVANSTNTITPMANVQPNPNPLPQVNQIPVIEPQQINNVPLQNQINSAQFTGQAQPNVNNMVEPQVQSQVQPVTQTAEQVTDNDIWKL